MAPAAAVSCGASPRGGPQVDKVEDGIYRLPPRRCPSGQRLAAADLVR
jgi:hypothetical protein